MRALIGTVAFVVGLTTVASLGLSSGTPQKPAHDVRELRQLVLQGQDAYGSAADAAQPDPTPPPQRPLFARFVSRWRDQQGQVWFRLSGPTQAGILRRERGRRLADPPAILLRLTDDWWYWERPPGPPTSP